MNAETIFRKTPTTAISFSSITGKSIIPMWSTNGNIRHGRIKSHLPCLSLFSLETKMAFGWLTRKDTGQKFQNKEPAKFVIKVNGKAKGTFPNLTEAIEESDSIFKASNRFGKVLVEIWGKDEKGELKLFFYRTPDTRLKFEHGTAVAR
jgi:hypothetical protein